MEGEETRISSVDVDGEFVVIELTTTAEAARESMYWMVDGFLNDW